MAGHFATLCSVLTEGPALEAHAMWMRDWPNPWHLESLVYLDLFASMSLQARSGLRYLDSFIYSRVGEADEASSDKSN